MQCLEFAQRYRWQVDPCTEKGSSALRTELPLTHGKAMAAKIGSRTEPFTWCRSAFGFPIWLCREGNNFLPKPIPMRFIALINDDLNIETARIINGAKRQC